MASQNLLTNTKGSDWDKVAKHGVSDNDNPSTGAIAALLAETDTQLRFATASSILDNGCGPGPVMTALLSQYGHSIPEDCQLTCSDFSNGMIEAVNSIKQAQIEAKNTQWPRVKTIVSNAMNMSIVSSDSQSHILAGWVYFMTPDPQACLAESKRMLKTGGVLGLSSWQDSQWLEVMRLLTAVYPDRQVPSLPVKWSSTDAVKHELEIAGFKDVTSKPITVYMGYETHEKLVRFLIANIPPMIAAVKGLTEAEIDKLVDVMVARCKEMNTEEPGRLSGQAIVAVGTK